MVYPTYIRIVHTKNEKFKILPMLTNIFVKKKTFIKIYSVYKIIL